MDEIDAKHYSAQQAEPMKRAVYNAMLEQRIATLEAELAEARGEVAQMPITKAMLKAATDLWWLDFDGDEEVRLRVTEEQATQIFRAMIAAGQHKGEQS